jgi:hypothetical protein
VITEPARQRSLRGHLPTRPAPRSANTAEHQARLAWRLTPRDHWIIAMLHEHRVLTADQLTDMAFPSYRSGRQRLRELYQWAVTDRFQPFVSTGSAPMHYVLGPAGAAVLAAAHGLEPRDLGYRHDRAFGIAHSLRLAHTVGVNEWFAALVTAAARASAREGRPGRVTLDAWWSEARCAQHFGDLVRPDGYGRWTAHGRSAEFFLEFDLGTEALTRIATKLAGYAALATTTAITTPLLVWVPTPRRETGVRTVLQRAWRDLDRPETVPVATAAAGLLDPDAVHPSPADPVWLPLDSTGQHAAGCRVALHRLADIWPQLAPLPTLQFAPTTATDGAGATAAGPTRLPAPSPMPAAPSSRGNRRPKPDGQG